jgi:hypothetical protein
VKVCLDLIEGKQELANEGTATQGSLPVDDTIVDAALPPRLVKYYGAPAHFDDMIFIGRASEFSVKYRLHYQPIVVGTEFFAKTNPPDPMELLNAWRRQKENV